MRTSYPDVVTPLSSISRFQHPSADSPFPLEYAFHLLGDIQGKTILDIGCRDGSNALLLATLGATVIALDTSVERLEMTRESIRLNRLAGSVIFVRADASAIPVEDGRVDGVLCAAALRQSDCVLVARQIRRILKPGGVASFVEQVSGRSWLSLVKIRLPKSDQVMDDEPRLTAEQVYAVSRAVGRPGRSREFLLRNTIPGRITIRASDRMKKSRKMDKWLLNRFGFSSSFASRLVWEARKES
jgi:SAM-dependent methyltransferase